MESAKFINKEVEAASFQNSKLQETRDKTVGEQLSFPWSSQGQHDEEGTSKKKQSQKELEETIAKLTLSEWVLRKENETLMANNLCMEKEYDEWHEKATRIMKKQYTQIDHL